MGAEWKPVLGGFVAAHPTLRKQVGLFCAVLDGQIVYIGRATETGNGGLAKRLADFSRESDSGRRHYAGERIHEHIDRLDLRVLVTGHGPAAARVAELLHVALIAHHQPAWNVEKRKVPKAPAIVTMSHADAAAPTASPVIQAI